MSQEVIAEENGICSKCKKTKYSSFHSLLSITTEIVECRDLFSQGYQAALMSQPDSPAPPIAQDTMREALVDLMEKSRVYNRIVSRTDSEDNSELQALNKSFKRAEKALAAHPTGQQAEEMNRFGYEKYQEGRRVGRSEATGQQEAALRKALEQIVAEKKNDWEFKKVIRIAEKALSTPATQESTKQS
jgi:hypothetical protein